MAENREEILANFQGITAIEDVAEAIYHLEEANWDLLAAINRVMPQDGASSAAQDNDTHDVEMIDDDISVITPKTHPPDREDRNQASTSSPNYNSHELVELQVHYNNKIHEVKISGAATVSDLKKQLESLCGVAVCRQQISGLGGSRATAAAPLATLGLPHNAVLRLKAADTLMADDEVAERLTTTYVLHVKMDDKEYTLKYPGTKTVQEVKNDIYSLTDIPSRHQVWTGWPTVTGLDETVLAMVGLDLPQHELTVKRAPTKQQKEYKRVNTIIVESSDSENSSVEEIEDTAEGYTGEDDMFVDLVQSERLQPLMSEHVEDEALGCIEFAARFRSRYGPNTPNFFEGTLQDAIKESCLKPAKERKLLGLYLHHEQSVLSNVFCAQLLGCEAVLQTLAANFIVYGWDLSHPDNNNMLLTSVATALGPVASMTIRSIPVDRLPALVIIMRVRSNTEIYSVINGNVGVSELLGGLVEALERFSAAREDEARLERERDARQRVKREQDEAYQRSLEADRAKEEVKKQQELERNQELERAESERQLEEAKKEAERQTAARRVPAEPAGAGAGDVARIRVRLPPPHHHCLERRFHASDTLAALLDFLASKGYPQEQYKVISSWPRRDLTMESHSSTLKALKLYPQETVMLEER
ncbi:FAS-associated factor 1 isoform X1 [Trichoplusia ni]|uniref:FAS-associated factor 1 isoform X1 n=1 Tax=Trichoplusia ni TaxID=7111 RepID=A0A7E5WIJ1_TRINI|nr:FAS-associated factor 1 isoform X1 [Trichoplusia ni]